MTPGRIPHFFAVDGVLQKIVDEKFFRLDVNLGIADFSRIFPAFIFDHAEHVNEHVCNIISCSYSIEHFVCQLKDQSIIYIY